MKKKFYINSNVERLISYAATLILILALNILLTNTLLKKITQSAQLRFIQDCAELVEDYANALESKLAALETDLDLIYAKIAYKTISPLEIQQIIIKARKELSIQFDDIFFADPNGAAYNEFGEINDINDRDYFKKTISGVSNFYVSNVVESKHDGSAILVFSRPVYNESNKIVGAICSACSLDTLGKLLNEIKIGSERKMTIRDANNRLIKHYKPKWVNWTFAPWKYVDKNIGTEEDPHIVKETINTEGELVYFFNRTLSTTPWTVGVTVTLDEFKQIEKKQKDYQYFILDIIIIVISAIFILELWMHSVLERHQILSTHIDSLTHLWVRSYFEKEATKQLKRNPSSKFMLIEADMRGFKFINQKYGEARANKTLLQFSKILYEITKSYNGILSRGYADHFYIFIKITSVHKSMHVFKQDLERITAQIKEIDIPLSPKFGITFHLPKKNEGTPSIQTLINQTTFARNSVKENALQQYAIYDSKMLRQSSSDNYIESYMHKALEKNEFFVMYQPKIDLLTDKVVGAEALVRWDSRELGYMPPNAFIPLFERNNFVVKLDFYVYEQVFKFLRKCLDNNEPVVPISVNMSRNHNKPDKFVHEFTHLLKRYDIPPALIEVELLERSSLDKNLLREITLMLQKEGFKVAMDDFGSGESSLNMLSTIPVNVLKFDRSFLFASDTENGTLDETAENFIETLVDLGKNLKKETIFEGVETEEQRDFLRKIKCDQVQGFFYSKPLREDEYMQFLKKHR
ncbi:MAG: GGDEF domain-containing protein [Treponema sp.]|nr:GGDEF domain-containing protein [Treponema sp.]